jgi:hypothetical protein
MRQQSGRRLLGAVLALACGLASGLLATGCAGTIRAQVLDAETRQPLTGVVVLGVWRRTQALGLGPTKTVAVQETQVDSQGRFELERPSTLFGEESVTVYKFGYVAWNNQMVFPSSVRRADTHIPEQIFVDLFPSGQSHREHKDFISLTTSGEGLSSGAPIFQKAVRREVTR